MVHVVSYDLQSKHSIFERRVEVMIGFDTGDPSGCTQRNQRLLFPVFRMLILDDGSQQTISLASRIILVFDFLKNDLSGVVSYNHLYFSPPLSNFKGGSFEPFEPPLLRACIIIILLLCSKTICMHSVRKQHGAHSVACELSET